ncbi:MAG: tetratricopeptide repeat protein [Planctomycetota bacterium]
MRQPLIQNYFSLLPEQPADANPALWAETYRKALQKFQRAVDARYNEATLERLLNAADPTTRRAVILALGLVGTMNVNLSLASRLHDDDLSVCELAADALWSIWFRADAAPNNLELQRLIRLDVTTESGHDVLAAFTALIKTAPRFAEAHNQRAIVHFRLGDFGKAVLDCEKTLRLNPVHFGAAAGMAQSFMKQRKLRAALRSFRRAYRINPRIDGIGDTIDSLEKTLGEEGKR